jgi:hypothetical protein
MTVFVLLFSFWKGACKVEMVCEDRVSCLEGMCIGMVA